MTTSKSYRFRIATSLAGLETGNFFVLDLPTPQLAFFNDHSTTRSQAQGGTARLGYSVASLLWPRLSMVEASIIQKMIEAVEAVGGEGNGALYLTLPKTLAGNVWIDISGKAKRPDWANLVDPDSEGQSYANVRLDLNNCTIEAEPSTVS